MGFRPLLGWGVSLSAFFLVLAMASWIFWDAYWAVKEMGSDAHYLHHLMFQHLLPVVLLMLAPLILLYIYLVLRSNIKWTNRGRSLIGKKMLWNVGLDQSILGDFPLFLKLQRLFTENGSEPKLKDCKFPVLLVAAPLQILPRSANLSRTKDRISFGRE